MPRLIDADALVKYFEALARSLANVECFAAADATQMAAETLKLAPTIDAKPVTYCNMCKRYEADTGYCPYHDHGMHWDDFCSCAAKMDSEEE